MLSTAPRKQNLLDLDRAGLQAYFSSIGEKPFRAEQVLKWIYHEFVVDFDAMSNLSVALREKLKQVAEIRFPVFTSQHDSADGTIKWLVETESGGSVETVFIPETDRGTLCVSSQVGCALNCQFCSTGAQGFNRSLNTYEIIGQVWLAAKAIGHKNGARKLTNVVMMGMGEPLVNLENVLPALELMRDDFGFGLANKRVTVSTAGVVPGMDALREKTDVALAVSLHAPNDELRTQIVPLNRKYPIEQLIAACQRYVAGRPRSTITFEYTLLDGVNDLPEHARQLVKLMRKVPSKLNLIPFNPFPGTRYKRPDPLAVARFQRLIREAGELAMVRKTRGDDIDAACGQLAGAVEDRTRRSREYRERMGIESAALEASA
jgi:23S rRNA (adenine2503-C2)-methyltransferase